MICNSYYHWLPILGLEAFISTPVGFYSGLYFYELLNFIIFMQFFIILSPISIILRLFFQFLFTITTFSISLVHCIRFLYFNCAALWAHVLHIAHFDIGLLNLNDKSEIENGKRKERKAERRGWVTNGRGTIEPWAASKSRGRDDT